MPSRRHQFSPTIDRPARRYGWISDAYGAAYEIFDEPQMASASALLGAASRIIFAGSGPGVDAAAFGSSVFGESGFDAFGCHAGDLTTGNLRFQPGDLVVGIDSNSSSVASAMRRARNAGLHTVGITNRELTIVDADVLLYVPSKLHSRTPDVSFVLGCCLTLALLAARLEPRTAIASEIATIERSAHRVTSESGRLMASILFGAGGDNRIVFAGRGVAQWVAGSMSRKLNDRHSVGSAPFAVDVDLHDVIEGFWTLGPADILVEIDPYDEPALRPRRRGHTDTAVLPRQVWTFTQRPATSSTVIHLPGRSPALGGLIAFTALSALLEFAGSSTIPSP